MAVKIKLEPEQLNRMAQKLKSAATDIQGQSLQLNTAYRNIDWVFTSSGCVDEKITQADKMRKQVTDEITRLSQYVQTAAICLTDADKRTGNSQIATIPTLPWWQHLSKIIGGGFTFVGIVIAITNCLPWIRNIIIQRPILVDPIIEKPISNPVKPVVGDKPIGVWPVPNTGNGNMDTHKGFDISGNRGDPIKSVLRGKVFYAGTSARESAPCKGKEDCHLCKRKYIYSKDPEKSSDYSKDPNLRNLGCSYGNVVKIDTIEPINGKYYRLIYAHLDEFSPEILEALNNGTPLPAGTLIGGMGTTGASDSNHLHFQVIEIDKNGKEISNTINEEEFLKLICAL